MTRASPLPLLLLLSLSELSLAQPAAPPTPAEAAPRPDPAALTLHCALDARPDLGAETLRAAIARELGLTVELSPDAGGSPLKISVESKTAARVRFLNERGVSIERNVELPNDTGRAVEVITWVTGNLARDEAASLVDQYRARSEAAKAKAAADAAEPPRAPPPAPAPAPKKPAPKLEKKTETKAKKAETIPAQPAERSYENTPVNLSLFHPISLYPDSRERRFNFELGLAYGRIGALRGVGLELGLLRVDGPAEGVFIGGALATGGDFTGYASSLIYTGGRNLTGVDTSFIGNWSGDVRGGEVALAFARARDVDGIIMATGVTLANDVRGAQLAAGANVSHSVEGAVLAAGANVSGVVKGVTAAAGANLVDRVEGASLAAGLNLSQDVNGVQLAVINVGGRVRGAQLGVINVAKEMNGAAIGVVNIAGNGEVGAVAWTNNFAPLHAALRFRSGYAYSELGVGLDPASDEYLLESGVGAHLPIVGPFVLEPGVHHSITKKTDQRLDEGEETERLHYRIRALFRLTRHLDVFAGGGVRHAAWGDYAGDVDPEVFAGIGVHSGGAARD